MILVMIKRVMKRSWLYHSALMRAPFGFDIYDYPTLDSGSLFALKSLGDIVAVGARKDDPKRNALRFGHKIVL